MEFSINSKCIIEAIRREDEDIIVGYEFEIKDGLNSIIFHIDLREDCDKIKNGRFLVPVNDSNIYTKEKLDVDIA